MKYNFKAIELNVKKMINSFMDGIHQSLLQDTVYEIDTIHQYIPGDKKLDTKSSLRNGLLMSKVFNPLKDVTVHILLDISGSQNFKKEEIITVSLFLNYLADACFDKVNFIGFNENIKYKLNYPNDINHILRQLYESHMKGNSNLENALKSIIDTENSVIFIISDFYYELSNKTENYLRSLSNTVTNKLFAITIQDQVNLPNKPIDIIDIENGEGFLWVKGDFNQYYKQWLIEVKNKLGSLGVNFILLGENYLNILYKFILQG